jgi:peptide/nickel transport system substrate-binding protein
MMLTGEADLAPLATKDLLDLAGRGYVVSGTGRAFNLAVPMAGNYWETTHAVTGAKLDTSGLFNNNLPLQGNPTSQADLDQAKLVRNALARAIDRETIARQSYADVAKPLYIGSFFPNDPNWNDKWKVPYDPAAAEKMLDEAGYKKNAAGIRFSMPLFGQSDNQLFFEASEIVAGYWKKIGI